MGAGTASDAAEACGSIVPADPYAGSRVVKESGDSGIELKQAAESVATANGPALGTQRYVRGREEEKVSLALVVSFKMMMVDVFVQRPA